MNESTDTHRDTSHHPAPPADPAELEAFPARVVDGDWYRSHVDRGGTDRGCWWFAGVTASATATTTASMIGGRFDLDHPWGTCYLGSSDEVAARERVGTQLRTLAGGQSVTAGVLATPHGHVVVSRVDVGPVRAANLPVKDAQRWIDRSLWSGTGIYAVTRAWARAWHRAGFGAIAYPPRFALGQRARALAVFGPAGRPDALPPIRSSRPLAEVLGEHGVRIVHPPATPTSVLPASAPPPSL